MGENKRIVVNTIFLYTKFIIVTIINLVMSRLVLKALGASDYGLYNVVGGIVAMLNTMGTSMISTSYRYMAVEIGKGINGNPNKTYNTIIIVHIALALFLLIAGETFGIFYINNYLNVDAARIPDALFVLHLSLLTTAFSVITIPMNGLIIAREKFLFTSLVETISAVLKIIFVIFLMSYTGNQLRFYAVSLAIVHFLSPLAYQIYCRIKDPEIVKWKFNRIWKDYKELFAFAWWILVGAVSFVGRIQGANIIINHFFGTILNAAFGLASQVNHAVASFTTTIRQATVPQIMKNQGGGNEKRSLSLVYTISRFSYLSMSLLAIPVLFYIDEILVLWLANPPKYTSIFVTFLLINGMVSNLGAGFDASIQATGKIRKNQIGLSIIHLSLLPIIYILYRLGLPPYINVMCMVVLTAIALVFQITIMKELTSFNLRFYLKNTILPSVLSTVTAVIPLILLKHLIVYIDLHTIIFVVISLIWTCFSVYLCGLTKTEKNNITTFIKRKLHIY